MEKIFLPNVISKGMDQTRYNQTSAEDLILIDLESTLMLSIFDDLNSKKDVMMKYFGHQLLYSKMLLEKGRDREFNV